MEENHGKNTSSCCMLHTVPMCELETQLSISKDLEYIDTENALSVQRGIGDIERMLKTLIKSLEAKP